MGDFSVRDALGQLCSRQFSYELACLVKTDQLGNNDEREYGKVLKDLFLVYKDVDDWLPFNSILPDDKSKLPIQEISKAFEEHIVKKFSGYNEEAFNGIMEESDWDKRSTAINAKIAHLTAVADAPAAIRGILSNYVFMLKMCSAIVSLQARVQVRRAAIGQNEPNLKNLDVKLELFLQFTRRLHRLFSEEVDFAQAPYYTAFPGSSGFKKLISKLGSLFKSVVTSKPIPNDIVSYASRQYFELAKTSTNLLNVDDVLLATQALTRHFAFVTIPKLIAVIVNRNTNGHTVQAQWESIDEVFKPNDDAMAVDEAEKRIKAYEAMLIAAQSESAFLQLAHGARIDYSLKNKDNKMSPTVALDMFELIAPYDSEKYFALTDRGVDCFDVKTTPIQFLAFIQIALQEDVYQHKKLDDSLIKLVQAYPEEVRMPNETEDEFKNRQMARIERIQSQILNYSSKTLAMLVANVKKTAARKSVEPELLVDFEAALTSTCISNRYKKLSAPREEGPVDMIEQLAKDQADAVDGQQFPDDNARQQAVAAAQAEIKEKAATWNKVAKELAVKRFKEAASAIEFFLEGYLSFPKNKQVTLDLRGLRNNLRTIQRMAESLEHFDLMAPLFYVTTVTSHCLNAYTSLFNKVFSLKKSVANQTLEEQMCMRACLTLFVPLTRCLTYTENYIKESERKMVFAQQMPLESSLKEFPEICARLTRLEKYLNPLPIEPFAAIGIRMPEELNNERARQAGEQIDEQANEEADEKIEAAAKAYEIVVDFLARMHTKTSTVKDVDITDLQDCLNEVKNLFLPNNDSVTSDEIFSNEILPYAPDALAVGIGAILGLWINNSAWTPKFRPPLGDVGYDARNAERLYTIPVFRKASLVCASLLVLIAGGKPSQTVAGMGLESLALNPEKTDAYILQSSTARYGDAIRAALLAGVAAVPVVATLSGEIFSMITQSYDGTDALVFLSAATLAFGTNMLFSRRADNGYKVVGNNTAAMKFIYAGGGLAEISRNFHLFYKSAKNEPGLAPWILKWTKPVIDSAAQLTGGLIGQLSSAFATYIFPWKWALLAALILGACLAIVKTTWLAAGWNGVLFYLGKVPVVGVAARVLQATFKRKREGEREDEEDGSVPTRRKLAKLEKEVERLARMARLQGDVPQQQQEQPPPLQNAPGDPMQVDNPLFSKMLYAGLFTMSSVLIATTAKMTTLFYTPQ